MKKPSPCPECEGTRLFRRDGISSGGGYAPNYLGGLGGFLAGSKFSVVVCADCGLTRFYAAAEARAKLADSKHWLRT